MRANAASIWMALVAVGCSGGGSASNSDAATGAGGASSGGASGAGGAVGAGGAGAGGKVGTGGASGAGGAGGAGAGGAGAGGKVGTGGAGAGGKVGTGGSSSGTGGGPIDAATGTDASSSLPGWTLTWSDEFDGADGSAVDPTKWVHDTGGDGWGNQELEYYTDGTQNAVVQGGNLVITATTAGAAAHTCSYPTSGGPCQYTSARLLTKGKFSQQYGRFEARVQIPEGKGLWPAFWLLGADIDTVNWPTCGETDIMENIGSEPSVNHGSLHMPAAGTTNDDQLTGMYTLPGNAKLGDGFHTYAVEWSAAAIKFYVDDNLYETQTPATATGRTWEYDHPFFILLNVAVGGQFPGAPDATTTFPQTMKVDWVRVYEASDGG